MFFVTRVLGILKMASLVCTVLIVEWDYWPSYHQGCDQGMARKKVTKVWAGFVQESSHHTSLFLIIGSINCFMCLLFPTAAVISNNVLSPFGFRVRENMKNSNIFVLVV